jgi:hypothetical protein
MHNNSKHCQERDKADDALACLQLAATAVPDASSVLMSRCFEPAKAFTCQQSTYLYPQHASLAFKHSLPFSNIDLAC